MFGKFFEHDENIRFVDNRQNKTLKKIQNIKNN